MPKLKRTSGKDTIRRLEKLGFKRIRQRGSLRQAKLSVEEFTENP